MSDDAVLVQLSDLHLGATWGPFDPEARLQTVVGAIDGIGVTPDALLVTGDLVDNATDAEYERVAQLLDGVGVPVHVLPGNHDRREPLRRRFGAACEPIADVGPLRVVMLDTTVPGADGGALDGEQLQWLAGVLADEPRRPTVVAMHHPPLVIGVQVWDDIGLAAEHRAALADILRGHGQVRRIVAGHVHRTMSGELGATDVLVAPSTFAQARYDRSATEIAMSREPAGFVVHTLRDGALLSLVATV